MNAQKLIQQLPTIMRPLLIVALLAMHAEPSRAATWTAGAAMPTARRGLAATSSPDGTKIYALGGSSTLGILNTVEVYNASARTWSTAAPMPTAREYLVAATGQNGTIYALGGRTGTSEAIATVEAYSPSFGSWSTVSPMLTARSALATATCPDGKIYAVGGRSVDELPLDTLEVYDPLSDRWTALRPMPTPRRYLAAVMTPDGQLYVIGGSNGVDVFDRVEVYNTQTDTWTTIAPLRTARTHTAAAIGPNGVILAFGGYNRTIDFHATVEAYNTSSGTWDFVDPMPTARHSLAGVGALGTVYAMGGTNAGGALNRLEIYGSTGASWSGTNPLTVGRESLAATTGLDGKIYVPGGMRDGRAQSVVEVYNPSSRDWSTIAPLQTARWGLAAATGPDGRIYAMGGFSSGGFLFGVEPELQLFNIGLEYVDELDRGEVSEALLDEFRRHGRALGLVYGVEVELTGSRWTIHDVDSQTDFRIRNDGTVLRVYLDFVRELNDLIASHDLRDQFRIHGSPLSPNYEVDVVVRDLQWKIHDLDADTYFHVRAEGGTLNVYNDDDILNTVEVYDPSTDRWSYARPMPFRACFLAAATGSDNRIYAFGGCDRLTDCDRGSPFMMAYTPDTDSWVTLSSMEKGRAFLAGAAGSDGRIYAIGGIGLDPDLREVVIHDSVEAYNPLTDSWSNVARMPTPRMGLAAAVGSDGTIYAIGGNNRTSLFLDTVESLSPSGTWSTVPPMPTRRRDLAAAASSVLGINRIFAIGGHGVEFPLTTVEVYTP